MERSGHTELGRTEVPAASGAEKIPTRIEVALLTAGRDKPYALGLAEALLAQQVHLDFIGSDEVSSPQLINHPQVHFLNLRGDQRTDAPLLEKVRRIITYYSRLIRYALTAKPKIFHILWNNKFEIFDRTVLMAFYRLLGKRVVFTAHNVNAAKRDSHDSWLNRLTLRVQYRLSNHIFVHTERMKTELRVDFGVPEDRITVIPFGINSTVPNTNLTTSEAKAKLGIGESDKTLLFFGNIAPYKGLDYLISAFNLLVRNGPEYRLIIAGQRKAPTEHWNSILSAMSHCLGRDRIIRRLEYIPDEQTELYFKAADVLILPYTHIFQSGVLFLGYNFGLPIIAADVGSLKDEIIEGKTGFVCRPRDAASLARTIDSFFQHPLHLEPGKHRLWIQKFAKDRYCWAKVVRLTKTVYHDLLTGVVPVTCSDAVRRTR